MYDALRKAGFDEKEAEMYVALLKLRCASAAELTKATSIERRTVYDVLNRLINNGWASYYKENSKKIYAATKPEIILENLKQRNEQFAQIIPQLNKLHPTNQETRVELLKGVKGLRTVFMDIISSESTHYAFGDISPFISDQKYTGYVKEFLSYLQTRNIPEKIIYPEGQPIKKISSGEYRSLNPDLVTPTPTIVYDNITIQFVVAQPLTIIKITSQEVAKTNKEYFNTFWELAS